MAPKKQSKKDEKKDKVIVGEDHGQTSPEQAAEARGLDDKAKEDKSVDRHMLSVVEDNLSPEQKRSDAIVEGRLKHYEKVGTDYIKGEIATGTGKPAAATWKTGKKVKGQKMYSGDLTLKGVSQSGHEISTRIKADTPKTEEELFYIFCKHHDSAVRDGFEIDEKNKEDSMLQTPFG